MSSYNYTYSDCDCVENSINDNKLNAKRARSVAHQLKQFLKPLVTILKKKNKKNGGTCQNESDCFENEITDNRANEALEARIFEEIDCCGEFAGVPVFDNVGRLEIHPVFRGQRYIPVNFAKTEAGTFFWTTVIQPDFDIDCHGDENAICTYQKPALQVPCDRWAQA